MRIDARVAALPAAVLVVVAVTQLTLVTTSGLNPWRGAGFGMFSTIDRPAYRTLQVALVDARGASVPAELASVAELRDAEVARRFEELLMLPDRRRAERFVASLARFDLVVDAGGDVEAAPAGSEARWSTTAGEHVVAVELTVSGLAVDDGQLVSDVVRRHVVPIG